MSRQTDEYVKCRTYGHGWDEFYPTDLGPPEFGWRLSLRCTRCTTERHDIIDRLGAVAGRRYIRPADYGLSANEDPMRREQYRLELFKQVQRKLDRANAIAGSYGRIVSINKRKAS